MCGIGAIITKTMKPSIVRDLVLALIDELSIRGTDAAGIAAFKDGRIFVAKAASPEKLVEVLEALRGWEYADVILVHDRAATTCYHSFWCHHPLIDVVDGRPVALVHNGVIYDITEELPIRYDVDTDALLGVLRKYGFNLHAITTTFDIVGGWYAVLTTNGRRLYAYVNDAPLAYAEIAADGMGGLVFASTKEILWSALWRAGIAEYARRLRRLKDGTVKTVRVPRSPWRPPRDANVRFLSADDIAAAIESREVRETSIVPGYSWYSKEAWDELLRTAQLL